MKQNRNAFNSDLLIDFIVYGISFFILIITLYPFLYVLSMSVSIPAAVNSGKVFLFPVGFDLGAYKIMFSNKTIWLMYLNSIWVVVFGTIINLFTTLSCAYVLSRKEFSLKRIVNIFITVTMFFSGGLIPFYIQVQSLGLINSRWALVLPVAANAWYIIIARTYFMTLPDSIEESARIDGCNNFKILLSIILPISMPIIAVIVLYSAVYHWNAYFNAMLFVTNPKKQPIQLYLARVIISNQMSAIMQGMADNKEKESYIQHLKYAIIIITILPIMCVYPFLQKYFVKGLLLGSVKG